MFYPEKKLLAAFGDKHKLTFFDNLKTSPFHQLMYLKKLKLFNFKNHLAEEFDFSPEVNCFTGPNGSGKTNVLDAIHYLALCKSYFSGMESQNITEGAQSFAIHGLFENNGLSEDIICGLKQGQRKIVKRNQKDYTRLAEHIGLLPIVMIAPNDQELISGGSEERRKLIDSIICQVDKEYLDNLSTYQRILLQRNALLKQLAAGKADFSSLEIWDEQLALTGNKIFNTRTAFIQEYQPLFLHFYQFITDQQEAAVLEYESQLQHDTMLNLLKSHSNRDRLLQYTTTGIHKDDLKLSLNEKPVRRFGSQGQQKSFVVALKLAQFEYIKQATGKKPMLLLDDIFEKLDDERMNKLLELVSDKEFGQLFVTDTHKGRAEKVFGKLKKEVAAFHFMIQQKDTAG